MVPALTLHVTDMTSGSAFSARFDCFPVFLGRGAANTVNLPSPIISKQHVEIDLLAGRLLLRDLGSRNGTLIRRTLELVPPYVSVDLEAIDGKFVVGPFTIEAVLERPSEESGPRADTAPHASCA